MATAVDDRGGRSSGGKRRQRKRATRPKDAEPPVEPVLAISDDLGALATAVAAMASAEVASPPPLEVNGHEPALPPAVLDPVTEAAPAEEFTDLLGQAVGLRIDSVSREFGHGDEMHVTALKDVSLQIGPCEFVSIVGPSGCGKTTLLSLMGGLDKPTSGNFDIHITSPGRYTFVLDNGGIIRRSARSVEIDAMYKPD